MSSPGDKVFVDSGAWIALAVVTDPYHARARAAWDELSTERCKLVTSGPVMIETFTFLDRNAGRAIAVTWRDLTTALPRLVTAECTLSDLTKAWRWFEAGGFVRLSVVDATSFVLMQRMKLRRAFAFDQHFAQAGFRVIG